MMTINPWIGLNPYREGDTLYGRDNDAQRLLKMLMSERALVLCGRSGVGKTSLIHACICPAVREKGIIPIVIRLFHFDYENSYISQIIQSIKKNVAELQGNVYLKDLYPLEEWNTETLTSFFERHIFEDGNGQTLKLLLILDHFEEMFSLNNDLSFLKQIDEAIVYDYKDETGKSFNPFYLLISIREDYVSMIDRGFTSKEFRINRFYLDELNEEQAYKVITQNGNVNIDKKTSVLIIQSITGRRDFTIDNNSVISISPRMLSIYLHRLYEKSLAYSQGEITEDLVNSYDAINCFKDLYDEATAGISQKAKEYIEDVLITSDGRRNNISESDVFISGCIQKEELKVLEGHHIIRRFLYGKHIRIELASDIFCPILYKHISERETIKAQRKELEEAAIGQELEDEINSVKYDVFISYSRKDYLDKNKNVIEGNVISVIKETLHNHEISYWMDEKGNLTGRKFANIIAGKIRESMVFLFVCSRNSVASKWVDRELSVADELNKHIIPLICDDSYLDDKVIMFTTSLDRIEYYSNPQKELEKLISAIENKKNENKVRQKVEGKVAIKAEESMMAVEVHIDVDANCDLFRFKTFIQHLVAGEDNVILMDPGNYKFEFVSSEYPEVKSSTIHYLATGISCDFIEIAIKDKIDALLAKRKDAEEKAKQKAGENTIIRTEDMKHKIVSPIPKNDNKEKKYDVFICYRRMGGADYARVIKLKLEGKYSVFMDYNVLLYDEFEQRIADIINKSSVFLIILSKDALNRCSHEADWVRKEIQYAMKFGCHIVPVVVDDTFDTLPASFPDELRRVIGDLQWSEVRMGSLFEESMNKLESERIEPYIRRKGESSFNDDKIIDKFNTRSKYRIKSELELSHDNRVIIKQDGNENAKIIELNESAIYLWKEIKEMPFDLELLASLLTKEYDVNIETARKDCIDLLESWYRSGLVYKL